MNAARDRNGLTAPDGRFMMRAQDEFLMLRDTLVRRPAGVRLAGVLVLAGVLALLASPDMGTHSHVGARQPFKLGLLQPSVPEVVRRDACISPQKPDGFTQSP